MDIKIPDSYNYCAITSSDTFLSDLNFFNTTLLYFLKVENIIAILRVTLAGKI